MAGSQEKATAPNSPLAKLRGSRLGGSARQVEACSWPQSSPKSGSAMAETAETADTTLSSRGRFRGVSHYGCGCPNQWDPILG